MATHILRRCSSCLRQCRIVWQENLESIRDSVDCQQRRWCRYWKATSSGLEARRRTIDNRFNSVFQRFNEEPTTLHQRQATTASQWRKYPIPGSQGSSTYKRRAIHQPIVIKRKIKLCMRGKDRDNLFFAVESSS